MTPSNWGQMPDYNHLYHKISKVDEKLNSLIAYMDETTRLLKAIETNQAKLLEASKKVTTTGGGGAVIVRM